jgi:hypothetical protein
MPLGMMQTAVGGSQLAFSPAFPGARVHLPESGRVHNCARGVRGRLTPEHWFPGALFPIIKNAGRSRRL